MPPPKNMTPKERAKLAADERWHPKTPKATHSGVLIIGTTELACDVLEDGRRILRQRTFLNAMERGKIGGEDRKRAETINLPIFLTANNLTPYLEPNFTGRGELILYKGVNGQKLKGYDATILPEVCKVYSKAEDDGVLKGNQLKIAKVCRGMLYGLATVGIIALVDDATGYVEQRNRNELEKILEKYIAEELRAWTKKFPNEFFKQVYRIHGWEYDKITNLHPRCTGKFINKFVYEKLPPGILEALKSKNPQDENGRRKFTHHRFLTEDIGDDNLRKQITQVITLMKVSDNLDEFKEYINKIND
jgi:hypothetical protein